MNISKSWFFWSCQQLYNVSSPNSLSCDFYLFWHLKISFTCKSWCCQVASVILIFVYPWIKWVSSCFQAKSWSSFKYIEKSLIWFPLQCMSLSTIKWFSHTQFSLVFKNAERADKWKMLKKIYSVAYVYSETQSSKTVSSQTLVNQ